MLVSIKGISAKKMVANNRNKCYERLNSNFSDKKFLLQQFLSWIFIKFVLQTKINKTNKINILCI